MIFTVVQELTHTMDWTIDIRLFKPQFGCIKATLVPVHEETQQYERSM